MATFIEIQWTCGNIDEARRVSRFLVQEKLVACAKITPWSESIYLWENELHTAQETIVCLKTVEAHKDRIIEVIKKNAAYEVPEITSRTVEILNKEYHAWVVEGLLNQALS